MLRPSMLIRTLLAGTNKMSITCGYLHRAGLRLRRRLQLVQHQRLRLLQQRPPHLQLQLRQQLRHSHGYSYCHSHSHGNSYCYSQTDADAEISSSRREPAPRHVPGRSYRRSVSVLAIRPRLDRARRLQENLPIACAVRISDFNLVTN